MAALYFWIFIISISIIGKLISWIREIISNSQKYIKLKPELDSLDYQKETLERKRKENEDGLTLRIQKFDEAKNSARNDLEKIARQKSMGFPWLAEAYAEYFSLRDLKRQNYLENKKHPALTTAEIVREIKDEKKELLKENKIINYKLTYVKELFPWLEELIAEDENEEIPIKIEENIIDDNIEDKVKDFLTPEEYKSLPSIERNQKALDRYLISRNKSKWAIGRDYEMYVGYLYTQEGYSIEYKGIIDGFDDMGRDVIAKKDEETLIIQCKYWAQYKEIHEKHIFQLFGTTMEYWIKNFKNNLNRSFEGYSKSLNTHKLKSIFYTSTSLSKRAKEMAEALNIKVVEKWSIGNFPRIKCNINTDEFGVQKRIYHLPMDQQYDRTIIGNRAGEFYAFTVKEAEETGFRRTFRHKI